MNPLSKLENIIKKMVITYYEHTRNKTIPIRS